MSLDSLLDTIYTDSQGADTSALEKTAEARLLAAISEDTTEQNPFEDMSLEELVKLASDQGIEVPGAVNDNTDDGMDKVAYEQLAGKIMAHASVHELGLIKEALANGACRVCKTNALDIEGSSICSECLPS